MKTSSNSPKPPNVAFTKRMPDKIWTKQSLKNSSQPGLGTKCWKAMHSNFNYHKISPPKSLKYSNTKETTL